MDQALKPLIIPVFIPHSGCPHQCAFCNQTIIASQKASLPDKKAVEHIITRYCSYKGKRKQVELAFFGGNFLGLEHDDIFYLLDMVQPYIHEDKINSIRFSTRPDTITRQILDCLKSYNISAIELGVQSMDDKVLAKSKRGHTSMDTIKAMHLLKKYPWKTGVQVMVGLPEDNEKSLLESTEKVAQLEPDFARIYPLMVLKGSLVAQWYTKGEYQPLSLEKSVHLVKKMVQIFKDADIDVIRMGLQASDMMEDRSQVLAGPWHPAFGHLVFSEILYEQACKKIDQLPDSLKSEILALIVHPRSQSRLKGDKKTNLKKLCQRYPQVQFSICLDETMPFDRVDVRAGSIGSAELELNLNA